MKHFDTSPKDKDKAINLVKDKLLKRAPTVNNAPQATTTTNANIRSTPDDTNCLLSRCFDQSRLVTKPITLPVNELDEYMSLNDQISGKDDVFAFWKENSGSFPLLSLIVREIYAIPASNTSVERLFSSSKNTVTDRRSSLSADRVNKLLFLQKNLFNLRTTNEETLLKQQEQQKRRLSLSDNEQIQNIPNKENLAPTSISKRVKTHIDFDYSSDDMDEIVDLDQDK